PWPRSPRVARRATRATNRATAPSETPETSLDERELLLQRLDVLFVHAHRLPQLADAGTIFLGVGALFGQRRRRAVGIGDARFGQQLLLGGELVRQHLFAHVVADLLRLTIDPRKARGRRCPARGHAIAGARALRAVVADRAGDALPALLRRH